MALLATRHILRFQHLQSKCVSCFQFTDVSMSHLWPMGRSHNDSANYLTNLQVTLAARFLLAFVFYMCLKQGLLVLTLWILED